MADNQVEATIIGSIRERAKEYDWLYDLLERYNWNLFFVHFPNIEDGNVYRIYKSHTDREHELIGWGKKPDEAIRVAFAKSKGEYDYE